MMHRKDRLDMAIKSAKTHLEGEHDNIVTKKEILQNSSLVNPKSRLNKLTGKKLIDPPKRTSILQRLSNKQRPTFDLIANNVLGKDANKYRPKLDVSTNSDDISGLVAKRLANLRERTLKKVEDDVIMSESSFFGFEPDGTPIWSSVVHDRKYDATTPNKYDKKESNPYHHSVQIPVMVEWPNELQFATHQTFNNWFTVVENKRATQLADAVVDFNRTSLNPILFIGESQTGKSHLMNAIGQATLAQHNGKVFFLNGSELENLTILPENWQDAFSSARLLLIDDIDAIVSNASVSNLIGQLVDYAVNMNVTVVLASKILPDKWVASRLWEICRSSAKSILTKPGANSLMIYARKLAMQSNLILDDSQLAALVTHEQPSWRSTISGIEMIKIASDSGESILNANDVKSVLSGISVKDITEQEVSQEESVEDIANRLINSVVDVVYSEAKLGGIEIHSELPELSEDYHPPNLDLETFIADEDDILARNVEMTIDNLTPEAPSVIDVNDRDEHLIAVRDRIIEKDHDIAADILTELDYNLDEQFSVADEMVKENDLILRELETKMLQLANKTSDASLEDLITIADELRQLEHDLVSLDPTRNPLPVFEEAKLIRKPARRRKSKVRKQKPIIEDLEEYEPSGEWNIDASEVSLEDLKDDISSSNNTLLEPHPDGRVAVATLTKKRVMLSGEEE